MDLARTANAMGSNVTTRESRVAEGKCTVCLQRKATKGHVTCPTCRKAINGYSASRYQERRDAKECVRCGAPAPDGYLCPDHAAERRKQRAK